MPYMHGFWNEQLERIQCMDPEKTIGEDPCTLTLGRATGEAPENGCREGQEMSRALTHASGLYSARRPPDPPDIPLWASPPRILLWQFLLPLCVPPRKIMVTLQKIQQSDHVFLYKPLLVNGLWFLSCFTPEPHQSLQQAARYPSA